MTKIFKLLLKADLIFLLSLLSAMYSRYFPMHVTMGSEPTMMAAFDVEILSFLHKTGNLPKPSGFNASRLLTVVFFEPSLQSTLKLHINPRCLSAVDNCFSYNSCLVAASRIKKTSILSKVKMSQED